MRILSLYKKHLHSPSSKNGSQIKSSRKRHRNIFRWSDKRRRKGNDIVQSTALPCRPFQLVQFNLESESTTCFLIKKVHLTHFPDCFTFLCLIRSVLFPAAARGCELWSLVISFLSSPSLRRQTHFLPFRTSCFVLFSQIPAPPRVVGDYLRRFINGYCLVSRIIKIQWNFFSFPSFLASLPFFSRCLSMPWCPLSEWQNLN